MVAIFLILLIDWSTFWRGKWGADVFFIGAFGVSNGQVFSGSKVVSCRSTAQSTISVRNSWNVRHVMSDGNPKKIRIVFPQLMDDMMLLSLRQNDKRTKELPGQRTRKCRGLPHLGDHQTTILPRALSENMDWYVVFLWHLTWLSCAGHGQRDCHSRGGRYSGGPVGFRCFFPATPSDIACI